MRGSLCYKGMRKRAVYSLQLDSECAKYSARPITGANFISYSGAQKVKLGQFGTCLSPLANASKQS